MSQIDQTKQLNRRTKVKRVECVYIPVTHAEASARWYIEHFGMELLRPASTDQAQLRISDDQTIFLIRTAERTTLNYTEVNGNEMSALTLEVEHLDELYRSMQEAGVRTDQLEDAGGCGRGFHAYDPDGNMLHVWGGWPEPWRRNVDGRYEVDLSFDGPEVRERSRIQSTLCVEIPVTNVPRAVDFYVNKLGLFINRDRNPYPIQDEWDITFIDPVAAGPRLVLVKADHGGLGYTVQGEPHHFLLLQIDPNQDLSQLRERLVSMGIKVGEYRDNGGCGRSFNVYDPDGNIIRLSDWK